MNGLVYQSKLSPSVYVSFPHISTGRPKKILFRKMAKPLIKWPLRTCPRHLVLAYMCSALQNTNILTAQTLLSKNSATLLKRIFLGHPVLTTILSQMLALNYLILNPEWKYNFNVNVNWKGQSAPNNFVNRICKD